MKRRNLEDISRLRQEYALLGKRLSLLERKLIGGRGVMLQGSIIRRMMQCGRKNCRCKRGELHGPYYFLSYHLGKGNYRFRYLGKRVPEEVKRAVERFRDFEGDLALWRKTVKRMNSILSKIRENRLKSAEEFFKKKGGGKWSS